MLECHNMDILPFSKDDFEPFADVDSMSNPLISSRRDVLQDAEEVGWCLFAVDVRNTYGLPFEVTFERTQEGRSA